MPVYIDKQMNRFGRMKMGHMIADTLDELHEMAELIGLRREWFQPLSFPHYDVSISRRWAAKQHGAIECERREFVGHLRRIRAKGQSTREGRRRTVLQNSKA